MALCMDWKKIMYDVSDVIDTLYPEKNQQKPVEKPCDHFWDEKPIYLDQKKLQELRWMDVEQLRIIFRNGKRKVKIEDSSAAYQELRWMDTDQLEAIFGKEEPV